MALWKNFKWSRAAKMYTVKAFRRHICNCGKESKEVRKKEKEKKERKLEKHRKGFWTVSLWFSDLSTYRRLFGLLLLWAQKFLSPNLGKCWSNHILHRNNHTLLIMKLNVMKNRWTAITVSVRNSTKFYSERILQPQTRNGAFLVTSKVRETVKKSGEAWKTILDMLWLTTTSHRWDIQGNRLITEKTLNSLIVLQCNMI